MLGKNSKIVILDDDHNIAEFTAEILSELGFENINVYSSIDSFTTNMRLAIADLFFLDVNLDKVDGLTLLSWIKAKQPSSKVVMFSGDTRKHLIKEASQLGAEGFLSKYGLDKNIRDLLNKWNVNYPLT